MAMKRTTGPYKGYFIISRTYPDGVKFFGRAWISTERPDAAGRAKSLEEFRSVGSYETEEKAMHAAEYQARQAIETMMPNWAPFTVPGNL